MRYLWYTIETAWLVLFYEVSHLCHLYFISKSHEGVGELMDRWDFQESGTSSYAIKIVRTQTYHSTLQYICFFFLWLSLLFFKQTWDSKTEHLRKQDLQVKNIYCTWYTAIYRYRYTLYNRLQWTEPLSSGGSLLSLFLSKDMAQLGHRRITLAMGFATLVVNEVGCWYDQFRRLGPICQLKNRIAPTWYGIYIYIRIYTYGNQHIVGMQWMETLSNKSGFWNFEYRWPLTGDL